MAGDTSSLRAVVARPATGMRPATFRILSSVFNENISIIRYKQIQDVNAFASFYFVITDSDTVALFPYLSIVLALYHRTTEEELKRGNTTLEMYLRHLWAGLRL